MKKEDVKKRNCPLCGKSEFADVSENFIKCCNCKVLIDFNNNKLHVSECPLCGAKDLIPLPSGNIRCGECNNSFVAGNIEEKIIL